MRVERREVAAGAGRDPAAERRELERLREVAQRQPVLAELLLEPRAGRAGLDARRARDRVDLEHAVERAAGRSTTAPRSRPRPRLDAADDARAAAVRDRRRARRRRTSRAPPRPRPRRAGSATTSGGWSKSPAERAHDVAVGLAVGVRGAVVALGRATSPRARPAAPAAARAARPPRAGPAPRARRPEARAARRSPAAAASQLLARRLLVLVAPAPVLPPAGSQSAPTYQWTPRIRCANATRSVRELLLLRRRAVAVFLPLALRRAATRGRACRRVLRIASIAFGATA